MIRRRDWEGALTDSPAPRTTSLGAGKGSSSADRQLGGAHGIKGLTDVGAAPPHSGILHEGNARLTSDDDARRRHSEPDEGYPVKVVRQRAKVTLPDRC